MKRFIVIYIVGFCGILAVNAQQLSQRTSRQVKELIAAFSSTDQALIANYMVFPYEMPHPIPAITSPKEFVKRFSQVFDEDIIKVIRKSNVEDWQTIGWRGTMLADGIVWMNDEGKVYRVTQAAKGVMDWRKQLEQQDKARLHPSVRIYEEAIALLFTNEYFIRIDRVKGEEYRLSAWKKEEKMSTAPSYVFEKGFLEIEGSMANRLFTFSETVNKGKLVIFLDFPGGESNTDVLIYYSNEAEYELEVIAKRVI